MELLFWAGSQCMWNLVGSLQEWSLCFPQSVELLYSNTLVFKAKCSGGSYSWCKTLILGRLMLGSGRSFFWENLYNIFSSLWVRYGMGLCHESSPPTISLWLLPCLERKISFLVGFSLFCQWLFSSCLRLWCFHERRWSQVLLLCHLFQIPETSNFALS